LKNKKGMGILAKSPYITDDDHIFFTMKEYENTLYSFTLKLSMDNFTNMN